MHALLLSKASVMTDERADDFDYEIFNIKIKKKKFKTKKKKKSSSELDAVIVNAKFKCPHCHVVAKGPGFVTFQ
jgi:hypothetical protein